MNKSHCRTLFGLTLLLLSQGPTRIAFGTTIVTWGDFVSSLPAPGAPTTVPLGGGSTVDVTVTTGGTQGLSGDDNGALGVTETGLNYSHLITLGIQNGTGNATVPTTLAFSNFHIGSRHIRGFLLVADVNGRSSPITASSSVPGAVQTWMQVGSTFIVPPDSSPITWDASSGTFSTNAPIGNDSQGIVISVGNLAPYASITLSLNQHLDDGIRYSIGEETQSQCGDGVVDPGEQCDDGNTISGDCCAADCTLEPNGSPCDDGLLCTSGETCDGKGVCRSVTPSAGHYAVLDWLPTDKSTTAFGRRVKAVGHVCTGRVKANGGTRVVSDPKGVDSGSVIGDLTSLIGPGSTAVTFGRRARVDGSVVTAGGEITHPERAAVRGDVVQDSTLTRPELVDCQLARTQVDAKYTEITGLSAPNPNYTFYDVGMISVGRNTNVRVPASGDLGPGAVIVDSTQTKLLRGATLTLVGSPATSSVIVRIRKEAAKPGNGSLTLGTEAEIVLENLESKQVLFVVVDGKATVGSAAKLRGTLLRKGTGISVGREARVDGGIFGPHPKVLGGGIVGWDRSQRQPWVGWCTTP